MRQALLPTLILLALIGSSPALACPRCGGGGFRFPSFPGSYRLKGVYGETTPPSKPSPTTLPSKPAAKNAPAKPSSAKEKPSKPSPDKKTDKPKSSD